MSRKLKVAAIQLGPVPQTSTRVEILARLLKLLEAAASNGAKLVAFPECTFTPAFKGPDVPQHWYQQTQDVTTDNDTRHLFERARQLGVDLSVGFAEPADATNHSSSAQIPSESLSVANYNTAIYYQAWTGYTLSRSRQVYPAQDAPIFAPGDTGFATFHSPNAIVGHIIGDDREYPEAWRSLGLQGVELVLLTDNGPSADDTLQYRLDVQANSCRNATWTVCATRYDLDQDFAGGSCIIDPSGDIVAQAQTQSDEVILHEIDFSARTREVAMRQRPELYKPVAPSTPKPINILLLNPNATASMTESCILIAQPTLPPDVQLHPFTGPAGQAPTAIESQHDAILSAAACAKALPFHLESLAAQNMPIAAILVACYSPHPLIPMLREELTIPIAGIMDSSLLYASTLGSRFGLIATSQRSKAAHRNNLHAMGYSSSCAGIESVDLGVLDLEIFPRQVVVSRMRGCAEKLVEQGAEVLLLGCAGMSALAEAVEEVVEGKGVEVVDGVVAGVQHLSGIVRMGGKTAKCGVYRDSAATRQRRGQDYI